jgi:hypothetical protein
MQSPWACNQKGNQGTTLLPVTPDPDHMKCHKEATFKPASMPSGWKGWKGQVRGLVI